MRRSHFMTAAAVLVALGISAPSALGLGAGGPKANTSVGVDAISADGRYLAFSSKATNVVPDDTDMNTDLYFRDLDTGWTRLVDRANGVGGAKSNGGRAWNASVSADDRYVAFVSTGSNLDPSDPDGKDDVFVRDLQTNTTTLVSRATGATGAKGNETSYRASISADGRYVAFSSNATNLDPADTDTAADVYVRDLQANTTTLVSRATGPAGVKGDWNSDYPSISADGRYVAFESAAVTLDPSDTDSGLDVYLRDLQSSTTSLVSRASGPLGAKGNGVSRGATITSDGRYVSFNSSASNFSPDDPDTLGDVYIRDLQTATTTLVDRASGLNGAKANAGAGGVISPDGRYIAFGTFSTNLSPDDIDGIGDDYVRDLQTGSTTLVSRATGAAGVKGNRESFTPLVSSGGRFVAFASTATNLEGNDDPDTLPDAYVRDTQDLVTSLEGRGSPLPARPKGATPFRVPLVPAYRPCTNANRTHGVPLTFPSCNPPVQASDFLTVGTPDANGSGATSTGFVQYTVRTGPGTDVLIAFDLTDVRVSGTLADYAGELRARSSLRLTDRANGPSNGEGGTVQDSEFAFGVPCSSTSDPATGSACALSTTANAIVPGIVVPGKRAIWELGPMSVFDGGADGLASTTGDNTLFADQGVFVP